MTIYIVLFRAKIGANTPLRHKCSSRYKLEVTPTSSALPRTLPSHLSQILNSTSYGLSLGVMLKCGALSLGVMFFWGRALSMLLYKLGVGLVGDKIGNHPNRPWEHWWNHPNKGGLVRRQVGCGRCGRTSSASSGHRLWQVGWWLDLGHSFVGFVLELIRYVGFSSACLGQDEDWMFLLFFPLLLAQLGMFSCLSLQSKEFSKTDGILLVQSPISRFSVVFDEFYRNVGGIECELRTANREQDTLERLCIIVWYSPTAT